MDFGKTVEFIRRQKNFSIKQICGDYLSRQTYYRFVKNEVDISSSKLFFMLDKLNVDVDEFLFICNNFQLPKEFSDMGKVKYYFEKNDIKSLEELRTYYIQQRDTKQKILFCLVTVLLGRLTRNSVFEEEKILKEYLFNIETWTHYEIVLFNNSMFIFDNDFIELVFTKVNIHLNNYSPLRYYGSESIRMLINMVILYIDRQDLNRAQDILLTLKNKKLHDDWIYEKCCILFFDNIITYLTKGDSLDVCKSILRVFRLVDSSSITNMFEVYLENINNDYPKTD